VNLRLSVSQSEAEELLGKELLQNTFDIVTADKSKGFIALAKSKKTQQSNKKKAEDIKPKETRKKNPGGKPVADFEKGDVVDGVVKVNGASGVFVDIGCEYDMKLLVAPDVAEREKDGKLKIMEELKGLRVNSVNQDRQLITVALDDASATSWAERRTKNPDGKPIAEFQEGEVLDGVIKINNRYGVFVDVGCEYDVKLKAPKSVQLREQDGMLKEGAKLKGLSVSSVDLQKMRIEVSLGESASAEDESAPSQEESDTPPKEDSEPEQKKDGGGLVDMLMR
jgi:transcriptional accessory protein Tex/SPT6